LNHKPAAAARQERRQAPRAKNVVARHGGFRAQCWGAATREQRHANNRFQGDTLMKIIFAMIRPAATAGKAMLLAVLALVAGCATPPLTYSGFLGDYAQLARETDRIDAASWRDPKANLKSYRKVMVDPPVIYYSAKAGDRQLNADLKDKLMAELQAALLRTLGARLQVTDQPGPDTLRVRTAITEVLPTGAGEDAMTVVDRVPLSLADAHMEAEVLDALTAQRLLAVVDSRRGRELPTVQNQVRWDLVRGIMRDWAQALGRRLDAQ
jgi:hypothetical protein